MNHNYNSDDNRYGTYELISLTKFIENYKIDSETKAEITTVLLLLNDRYGAYEHIAEFLERPLYFYKDSEHKYAIFL